MAPSAAVFPSIANHATTTEIAKACGLSTHAIEDIYDCTAFQANTMVEATLRSSGHMYRYAFKIAHNVDIDRLCSALEQVVWLNALLRTRIVDARQGLVQVVTNQPHRTQRLTGDLDQFFNTDISNGMGLGEPMFHSAIVNRRLTLTMHHAIMDTTSWFALLRDIVRIYRCEEPKRHRPFKDFVQWCHSIDDFEAKSFWASRFKGVPVIYPHVDAGYMPQATRQITSTLKFTNIDVEVPLFQVPTYIELAWAMTVGTYANSNNVVYGMALSGRNAGSSHDLETIMGPTAAIVPMQTKWTSEMTIREILRKMRASLRQLQTSAALQYGSSNIRNSSDAARSAMGFQAMLNIHPPLPEVCETGELSFERNDDPANAFALMLQCMFLGSDVLIKVMYDSSIMSEIQIKRLVNQFQHILATLMETDLDATLGSLPLLNKHDQSDIVKWNGADLGESCRECLHDSFRFQVQKSPEATAVSARDGSVTYRELDDLSDRVAGELIRRGLLIENTVAFCFEKSMWTTVAMLGILKAGGICVPINASDPPSRKEALMTNAGVKMALLSSRAVLEPSSLDLSIVIIDRESVLGFTELSATLAQMPPMLFTPSQESLAFILFTSGTTGTAKGVKLQHSSIQSALKAVMEPQNLKPGARIMQFAAHVWDASIIETLGTLIYGGCLCVPSEEDRLAGLARFIQSQKVEVALLTPTMLRSLSPAEVPSLRIVISCGEPVDPLAHKTWGLHTRFCNFWGPCEGGIGNTMAHLTPNSPFPETIGKPSNCKVWIVHPENSDELCPIGATGELLVEGPGVAHGYLNDVPASKASFISPPLWSQGLSSKRGDGKADRLYRTGDLGRYNPDGSISYIGRKDNQVKIRGQRFELGEVESILNSNHQVEDVFVSTKVYRGRNELVAVVSLPNAPLSQSEELQTMPSSDAQVAIQNLHSIREYARAKLPSYMLPTIWLVIEKMPQTASGKIDRRRMNDWLKAKDVSKDKAALEMQTSVKVTSPVSLQEKVVQAVWASVLDIPVATIGRESSFIRLGGDSMMAMQASNLLMKSGVLINTYSLLRNQSLESMVEAALREDIERTGKASPSATKRGQDPSLSGLYERLSHLSLSNPQFSHHNIECVVPATDVQALFLTVGPHGVDGETGYHTKFTLHFTPALDIRKLRTACEKVIQHHGILRTAFFQHGPKLHQVVLKRLHSEAVILEEWSKDKLAPPIFFNKNSTLARFHLFGDGELCSSLRLDMHHALYDGVSSTVLFQDLNLGYSGQELPNRPLYHDWVSHLETLEGTASRQFWIEVLRGSSMTHLALPQIMPAKGYQLKDKSTVKVPMTNVVNSFGTPSNTFKAAWALLLSIALDTADVVFGEISANRYLNVPGVDQLCGPCINFVPVRAMTDDATTVGSLIETLQKQELSGLSHHHLGIRSIIKDCTKWPRWTPLSTWVSYLDLKIMDDAIPIGSSKGKLSAAGTAAHPSEIMIAAIPTEDELVIELYHDSDTIAGIQMIWICQSLETILQFFHCNTHITLSQIKDQVYLSSGTWPETPAKLSLGVGEEQYSQLSPPSADSKDVVQKGWKKLALLETGQGEDASMFSYDGDIVSAMLLSEYYQYQGYDVSTKDIIQHPSRLLQAYMLDKKIGL